MTASDKFVLWTVTVAGDLVYPSVGGEPLRCHACAELVRLNGSIFTYDGTTALHSTCDPDYRPLAAT